MTGVSAPGVPPGPALFDDAVLAVFVPTGADAVVIDSGLLAASALTTAATDDPAGGWPIAGESSDCKEPSQPASNAAQAATSTRALRFRGINTLPDNPIPAMQQS